MFWGIVELNQEINRMKNPYFESVAIAGKGVFETLTEVCRLVFKAIEAGLESGPIAGTAEKAFAPSRSKSLRMATAAARSETFPSRTPGSPGCTTLLDKEGPHSKPSQQVLEMPRSKAMPQKNEILNPGAPPIKEITTLSPPKIQEEKKARVPIPASRTQEGKKQELSLKQDKEVEKKATLPKENFRILSCGQPRVISATGLELPLTLMAETGVEKSFLVSFNLLVNLGQIDPDQDTSTPQRLRVQPEKFVTDF